MFIQHMEFWKWLAYNCSFPHALPPAKKKKEKEMETCFAGLCFNAMSLEKFRGQSLSLQLDNEGFQMEKHKVRLSGAQLSKPVASDLSPVSKVLFDKLHRC